MRSLALGIACLGLIGLGMPARAAPFDPMKLMSEGEVYVVALHETYLDAADRASAEGEPAAAQFFHDRVTEIEHGEELFPANPSVYPCTDSIEAVRLGDAYEQAYAIATSEAADVEPYLAAAVQVAYEEWLVSLNADPNDPNRDAFQDRFERRLDALSQPQVLSHAVPPDESPVRARPG